MFPPLPDTETLTRRAIRALDTNPGGLAALIRVTPRAVRYWLEGKRKAAGPTRRLLADMIRIAERGKRRKKGRSKVR